MKRTLIAAALAIGLAGCASMPSGDGLRRTEHRVSVLSMAPSMTGQKAELYVREIGPADGSRKPVVLFVHGAGTPAEVSFDSRMNDYSWMRQVALAGFDVFSVSLTGYGGSTRPAPMANPCNIVKAQQAGYVPAPCEPDRRVPIATPASDWDDIDAVVEHLRKLRGVDKVSLVGWSQGGPRIAGYALRHPGKVDRLVALAPAYFRDGMAAAPAALPAMNDGVMSMQSRKDFIANWDRQVGCKDQYDPAAAGRIFDEMLESDPVGAKWGPGARRAPMVPIWGFEKTAVASLKTPFLMVVGEHDKQIAPQLVQDLYDDLASPDKVFVQMACSSHNAMWETHRAKLYDATIQWLRDGQYNGMRRGVARIGY